MCERGGSGARGVERDGLQRFQGCLADAHLCLRVGSFELPKKDIESGRYGANPWQSSQMHNLECHSHHNVQYSSTAFSHGSLTPSPWPSRAAQPCAQLSAFFAQSLNDNPAAYAYPPNTDNPAPSTDNGPEASAKKRMPEMMTTSLLTEPSTIKDVAVTRRWSHNPVYEIAQPRTHEKKMAKPLPLLCRSECRK